VFLKTLIVIAIFAIPLIPTFWAILDIPRRRFPTQGQKMVWFFVVATLPFFGAIFYILLVRRHTKPLEAA
jgi:hypothetical protein